MRRCTQGSLLRCMNPWVIGRYQAILTSHPQGLHGSRVHYKQVTWPACSILSAPATLLFPVMGPLTVQPKHVLTAYGSPSAPKIVVDPQLVGSLPQSATVLVPSLHSARVSLWDMSIAPPPLWWPCFLVLGWGPFWRRGRWIVADLSFLCTVRQATSVIDLLSSFSSVVSLRAF